VTRLGHFAGAARQSREIAERDNVIERGSSAAWVKGVVEMFAAEGVDVEALLRDAGYDAEALNDPQRRFSIDEVSVLWEMAVSRSGKATLGLSKELAATYGKLGVVGYAMMACPTLLAALERLVRYMNVVSNAATFVLTEAPNGYWFELGHEGGERAIPRQRAEFGMLTMLSFCSWITGHDFNAMEIEFVYPTPADASVHEAAFGCPIRFAQGANRALLRKSDLALALSARDPALAALHERLVEDELEKLAAGMQTSQRVQQVLAMRLSGAEPLREQVAAALKISDRTLQRRLQAEGTSFQQLLDDTRRELAQKYLQKPRTPLRDVAELLGFEDQSNLFRACKRWFGESPGRYRARFEVQRSPRQSA
jgi:AraC-like DNA-binding protein